MRLTKPALDLGIAVIDLERSLAFYRDLLQLPVRAEMDVSGLGHLVLLDLGASTLKLVALDSGIEQIPTPGGVRAAAAGLRYLTFSVADLDPVIEGCRQAGHHIAMQPTHVAPAMRVAAVEDPDGNWVEFLEVAS